MNRTHQNARRHGAGHCSRCGQDNIPDDQLFLAAGGQAHVGWLTVCQDCDDGDGSLKFHG